MRIFKKYIPTACQALFVGSLLGLAACGESDFKVKGEIYGAENRSIVLEKSDFQGFWIAIDSTRTSKSGSFSMKRPSPATPEIFRLRLDDRFIYFPVEDKETITVTSSAEGFGTDFTLSGSLDAKEMARFDNDLAELPAGVGADSLNGFKRRIYTEYIQPRPGSTVAYYILTKIIGKEPLFNPSDNMDAKYFAAVATGFKSNRPDDPRTRLLEATSVEAMKRRNSGKGNVRQVEAQEIAALEIELPDENGGNVKLSDVIGKGKSVVVVFSLMTHPDSPALNIELSKIYNSRPGGVEFYQVSLDPDQYAWRDAARNLPWITVYDADGQYSKAAATYNVGAMPVFFIYDSAGELKERAATPDELRKSLGRM